MGSRRGLGLLKGSWDLVTGVIIKVTILITPIRVLITLLTKSHDPTSKVSIRKFSMCKGAIRVLYSYHSVTRR